MRHFAALVGLWTIANANAAEWPALVIDEAIGPATVLRVERALDEAARAQTPLWITLDTPGGLLASTQR
ncbi:MAG: nodulation protein NfeD, partial [Zetaproteobacteria bacterium]